METNINVDFRLVANGDLQASNWSLPIIVNGPMVHEHARLGDERHRL